MLDNFDTLSAISSESLSPLFWHPARLGVESAWYGHVPFAHWIVSVHRPASIVELGAHNGVSYAAFCEAVVREQLDSRAIAIDTWQGDEHAGFYGSEVYTDLRRFHDQRYASFSTLMQSTFDDARHFILDGSIDLLHIDGRHHYDDVAHDFASWQPKLSSRAIVLFHDTNVRERDFGVWRLWAELRGRYPGFEFLHGHGLGVLAVGSDVSGPAGALCALQDSQTTNAIRERFSSLGERWITTRDLLEQQAILAKTNQDLAATRAWAETAQKEVDKLFPQYAESAERHRAARANLAQARYDLAALQRRLGEQDTAMSALHASLGDARAKIIHLERELANILGSRSWRITAPLRRHPHRHIPVEHIPPPAPAPAPDPEPQAAPAQIAAQKSILFVSGEDHTPGHIYRVERYVEAAKSLGFSARWMQPGPVCPADLLGVHAVILWRVPFSLHIQGIITLVHDQGGIVIFDVDDLMFRPELAVTEIIDGIRSQRFSEIETQNFFAQIGRTLKACDLVSCPTQELAHHARRLARPAYVLPNGFDESSHTLARWALRDWLTTKDDLIRIGYAAGSRTHQKDFAVAAPAIARVLRENPNTVLTVFRDPSSGEGLVLMDEFPDFKDLASQIEWRDMVGLADLPKELARFSINVVPLERGNPFCEAKSELKFFEAALVGVPTVASPSGPFKRAIVPGQTGLLPDSEDEWHDAITGLVQNPKRRQHMAQAAYHVSLGQFGPRARKRAMALMLAQIGGGEAGAAAFEQDHYRQSLPRPRPPIVPESDILFSVDRLGTAAVTVIIPVFNYADYVTEALRSVADQTLQTLDLVVIDDHSPDDSATMILDWVRANEARFNRIVVLRHCANAGLGLARNSGFAAAETDFVLPLDADNRLRPSACEALLKHLAASDAAFAYPTIEQFGATTELFGQEPFSVLKLQHGNYIDAMALVRKAAWASAGGCDHVQFGWEDFDFWCRLVEQGWFGLPVREVLAEYRVHDQSMLKTTTDKRENRLFLSQELERRHAWLDLHP